MHGKQLHDGAACWKGGHSSVDLSANFGAIGSGSTIFNFIDPRPVLGLARLRF